MDCDAVILKVGLNRAAERFGLARRGTAGG